jgi:G:T-mismatch repair DNA endonuclease (very short patch repair protein)
MTYGDDNEMSVSDKAPLYNHTRMMEVYAFQGIEYTMADKDAPASDDLVLFAGTCVCLWHTLFWTF